MMSALSFFAMVGKTSISAIRAILLLAQQEAGSCWSPRKLAETLEESPSYMAKVVRHLVKCGVFEAEKGVKGGVRLVRSPDKITLLTVVEACQGTLVENFCKSGRPSSTYCSFHCAAAELHQTITGVLVRWTIADLLERPQANENAGDGHKCLMGPGLSAPVARPRLTQLRAK